MPERELEAQLDALKKALFGKKKESYKKMPPVAKPPKPRAESMPKRDARADKRAAAMEVTEELCRVAEEDKICEACSGTDFRPVGEGKTSDIFEYVPGYFRLSPAAPRNTRVSVRSKRGHSIRSCALVTEDALRVELCRVPYRVEDPWRHAAPSARVDVRVHGDPHVSQHDERIHFIVPARNSRLSTTCSFRPFAKTFSSWLTKPASSFLRSRPKPTCGRSSVQSSRATDSRAPAVVTRRSTRWVTPQVSSYATTIAATILSSPRASGAGVDASLMRGESFSTQATFQKRAEQIRSISSPSSTQSSMRPPAAKCSEHPNITSCDYIFTTSLHGPHAPCSPHSSRRRSEDPARESRRAMRSTISAPYALSLMMRVSHPTTTGLKMRSELSLGRKNFLFVHSEQAGKNVALLYSLVGSCVRLGVNPIDSNT